MKPWRIAAEKALKRADSPPVLTTATLHLIAFTADATVPPSPIPSSSTLARWLGELVRAGKLEEVTKGVYLNVLGHRAISPAAAAHHVRHRSVVSLSWVLEQAGISNNYSDTITCVIPSRSNGSNPHGADLQTAAGRFVSLRCLRTWLVLMLAGGKTCRTSATTTGAPHPRKPCWTGSTWAHRPTAVSRARHSTPMWTRLISDDWRGY